jgi:formylglycine-generating enzyme required for sulfatase activity
VLGVSALLLTVGAWFSFTAVPVRIEVTPPDAEISLPATVLKFAYADRFLLRAGEHALHIERDGHVPIDTTIEVRAEPDQHLVFTLRKLPGRLDVRTSPLAGARVRIDGADVGTTPLVSPDLSAGPHRVEVAAERYLPFADSIDVRGEGIVQRLDVVLTPAWAPITITTAPPGATVRVDGEELGQTPGTFELLAGERTLEVLLTGYNPWTRTLVVAAQQPQQLPEIVLREADARLALTSRPPGAQVTLGTQYQGVTPLTVAVPSGEKHTVTIFKPGYEAAVRTVKLPSGATESLEVELGARVGVVEIVTEPDGAELEIDGRARGSATQSLTLVAVPHRITVRKDGYLPYETTVTPQPDVPRRLEVRLHTDAQARAAARPPEIVTKAGQRLVLVPGGRFVMGSSRRDRDRRPNEVQRAVELARPYYLGVREISNGEFRQFRPAHRSGSAGGHDLDGDAQPVTSVTWDDAARFCNWLSAKEGLASAYEERGGALALVRPVPNGYRLPTEAEWAWAARFVAGRGERRYPWGDAGSPPAGAGNYGDGAAAGFLTETIAGYTDGMPVAGPVAHGTADPLGLLHLGDNVAEWMNDFYTIYPQSSATATPASDPLGPHAGQHHVVRGASWRHGRLAEVRLAFRDFAVGARDDVGFRIARYAE